MERATGNLLDLLEAGGGEVQLAVDTDPYIRDMVYNLAILAVGLYDFRSNAHGNPFLTDLRDEACAEQALSALGTALANEIRTPGRGRGQEASNARPGTKATKATYAARKRAADTAAAKELRAAGVPRHTVIH